MTKKQFKKACRSLSATKWTRAVVGLRLFATTMSFVAFFATYIWLAISGLVSGADTEKVGEIIVKVFDVFKIEPISFFSLKTFGSLGSLHWADLLQGMGVNPELVTWVALSVCLLLTLFFSIRKKKSKKNVGAFFMLFLLSVVDLGINVVAYGIPAFKQENLMTFVGYGVGLLTVIMTFNAMVKGSYLKRNFEQGMLVKRRELRKIYKENVVNDMEA